MVGENLDGRMFLGGMFLHETNSDRQLPEAGITPCQVPQAPNATRLTMQLPAYDPSLS